jgi:cytochrome P450
MQAVTLEIILQAVFGVGAGRGEGAAAGRARGPPGVHGAASSFTALVMLGPSAPPGSGVPPRHRQVDRAIHEEIAARRGRRLAGRDDILSLLLQARDDAGRPLTDLELRDELVTLLVAGHETTATALSWAVERGLRTPGVMERLRDDLAAGDTAYLLAVCHETLGCAPSCPWSCAG